VNRSKGENQSVPLVSVIVRTYNRPHNLPVALDSIAKQTFRDFEVIIINDAGNSAIDIIRDFSNKFSINYIEHETNKGLSAALNTGIRVAKGKYIAYLDDDDIYYPDHLETLVGFLERSDFFIAYTDAYTSYTIEKRGQIIEVENAIPYSQDFDYERIFIDNFIPILCVVHQKSCLEKTGFFDENLKRNEDWDMWIRLSINYKLFHIKKVTCEFALTTDGTSMTSSGVVPFWESRAKIYCKYNTTTANIPNVAATQIAKLADIIQQFTTVGGEIINIDYKLLLLDQIKDLKKSKTYKMGYYILKPFKILKQVYESMVRKLRKLILIPRQKNIKPH
jgi:glycosyltransferase involved in cell wall biosynthesis